MSNEETAKVNELVSRLEKVAKKNKDEFKYRIEVNPNVTRGGANYRFVCTEKADGHEFVTGAGETIGSAVDDADESVGESCEGWGYKEKP